MFIKLLTYTGIWIAFGFAAGSMIWLGMVISRRRTERTVLRSQPQLDRGDVGTTYRVLKGGKESSEVSKGTSARRTDGEQELINFPR